MAYSTVGSIRCSFKLLRARAVASHAGQMAVIPGTDTEDVFRAKQLPHMALANLLDNEKSVAKFLECYGPLLATKDYLVTVFKAQQLWVGPPAEVAQELLKAHPEAANFFFYTKQLVIQYRDTLRKAWDGDRNAIESMRQYVAANVGSSLGFKKDRIEITAPDAWYVICILFLGDYESGKTAECGSPDCPAGYFLRKRRTQKFCEAGPCVAYGARERAKKWWHSRGDEWRAGRQKKSGKRGK